MDDIENNDPRFESHSQPGILKKTLCLVASGLSGSIGIAFVLFLLLHLRTCVVTVWEPSDYSGRYVIDGEDGREMELTLSDGGEVTISYLDEDGVLHTSKQEWWCMRATRILGPLHKPDKHLYRWVDAGVEPYLCEADYTMLSPVGSSVFPKPGRHTDGLVYFRDDAIKYEGMWLLKVHE